MAEPVPSVRAQAAALPPEPGVYLFKNAEGEVLYVGKATVLRERVRSYFAADTGRGPAIEQMVREARALDHQVTDTETEALLLEANLIRKYKPRYNVRLRDDKSFMLIQIDLSHPFPPIYMSREKDLEELLARKKRDRSLAINQKIAQQEFFGPYLTAGAIKAALKTIRRIWPFRDCTQSKYDHYAKLGHGCIFASLGLCTAPCAAKISQEEYRKNIDQIRKFLRGERQELVASIRRDMEAAANEQRYEDAAVLRNRLVAIEHLREMALIRQKPARAAETPYNHEQDVRIECYDISNVQGAYAVGSLISAVVSGGKIEEISDKDTLRRRFRYERSRYRRFRIKTVEGISDTAMLQEVLERRFKRAQRDSEKWSLPDLIILDGGKGQLKVALGVRHAFGKLEEVAIGSVAKGPTRTKVDLHGEEWKRFPCLSPTAWSLVAELCREEAHRFAIAYYRLVHRKNLIRR